MVLHKFTYIIMSIEFCYLKVVFLAIYVVSIFKVLLKVETEKHLDPHFSLKDLGRPKSSQGIQIASEEQNISNINWPYLRRLIG